MKFESLIGNDEIKKVLNETINKNKILNSYMFIGQSGIGKQQFAKEFARKILCISDNKQQCDNCESCIKFNSNNHPDFVEVSTNENSIKIAQIREMQEYIYQKPIVSNKKVFIINDAEKMTEEAQNSLLKTLEEPPEYVSIILIASNENLLLNTIKSRCVKIYFNNIDKQLITKYIQDNNIIENPTSNIIDLCNGSIGKAIEISSNLEMYTQVEEVLNNILNKKYKSIIEVMKNSEIIYKSKNYISQILEYMIVVVFNLTKANLQYSENAQVAFNIIKIIENTKVKLKSNSNYDMSIDELILKIWEEVN